MYREQNYYTGMAIMQNVYDVKVGNKKLQANKHVRKLTT